MPGLFTLLADVLFPKKCVFCRSFLKKDEKDICASCRGSLPYTGLRSVETTSLSDMIAPLYYRGAVRDAVKRLKFRNLPGYATCFGAMLAEAVREKYARRYDLISWVPVSKKRRAKRGYDQAMLLAMAMAIELGDVAVETLVKTVDVPAQSGITDAAQRRANVLGVYQPSDRELVAGKRVLLVDDVLTTGATMSECASVLKAAGAREVIGITLAWAGRSREGNRNTY